MQVMKITKIAEGLTALNTSRPIGSQASGETGRRIWISGVKARCMLVLMPIRKPSGMPTSAARPKPAPTRPSEYSSCQPMPTSFGPFS